MTDDQYEPIACSVHDKLEDTAVRGTEARFVVRSGDGDTEEIQARVDDLYARDGVEYMKTGEGREIRLDALHSVNGERVTYERP